MYSNGSPPPQGSKNLLFILRSVSNIVIAPAKTGRDRRSNREVIPIDQPNNGNRSNFKPSPRILKIVVIKLIEAKIDEMQEAANLTNKCTQIQMDKMKNKTAKQIEELRKNFQVQMSEKQEAAYCTGERTQKQIDKMKRQN